MGRQVEETPTTRTLIPTVLALVAGCTGSLGGGATPCERASDHLETCGYKNLPAIGECGPAREERARQILSTACTEIAGRNAFSSSDCYSDWSILDASCWGNGGGNTGGSSSGSSSSGSAGSSGSSGSSGSGSGGSGDCTSVT